MTLVQLLTIKVLLGREVVMRVQTNWTHEQNRAGLVDTRLLLPIKPSVWGSFPAVGSDYVCSRNKLTSASMSLLEPEDANILNAPVRACWFRMHTSICSRGQCELIGC